MELPIPTLSSDPEACRRALATAAEVTLDVETTGVAFLDNIVSIALLVGATVFVLPLRSRHVSVRNLNPPEFRLALEPLARPELHVIGHNLPFDLAKLHAEGIPVGGEAYDTIRLLRLLDSDRGAERGDDRRRPRIDRCRNCPLNYALKDTVRQMLGVKMIDFPGAAARLPWPDLCRYSVSDVVGTKALFDHLWPRLAPQVQHYYRRMVSPLVPILIEMSLLGTPADRDFIREESARLERLMSRLSQEHKLRYRVPLDRGDPTLRKWIYESLCLRVPPGGWVRQGKRWVKSLKVKTLQQLRAGNANPVVGDSLTTIENYIRARSLLRRLRSLTRYIESDGLFHSTFDDRQTSGRISSTKPNLQALAKKRDIAGEEFRCRNVVTAPPGWELAVFDVGQADIRSIAHAIASFGLSTTGYVAQLRHQSPLRKQLRRFREFLRTCLNPNYVHDPGKPTPEFFPHGDFNLIADLMDRTRDFYTIATTRILQRPPRDKAERDALKTIILGTINSQTAVSLAPRLKCSTEEVKKYLEQFARAYPELIAFRHLIAMQVALTGRTETFMGRPRVVTPHAWLVSRPEVEVFVSYKRGDRYVLRIIPLRAAQRILVCYVLEAWDVNAASKNFGSRIYHHQRGWLSALPYRLFVSPYPLLYTLPLRGIAWRSIRRVRTPTELAFYEGFDRTSRQLFNHIAQGNTSDMVKLMMFRAMPVCRRFGARLLLQVHDELVFLVPEGEADRFFPVMKRTLEEKPTPDFAVPIVVEAKRGRRFGDLDLLEPCELSDRWLVRFLCRLRKRLRRRLQQFWAWVKRLGQRLWTLWKRINPFV